jgi:hypothetical protein
MQDAQEGYLVSKTTKTMVTSTKFTIKSLKFTTKD